MLFYVPQRHSDLPLQTVCGRRDGRRQLMEPAIDHQRMAIQRRPRQQKLCLLCQETRDGGSDMGGSGRHSFWCHGGGYREASNIEHGSRRLELHGGVCNYSDICNGNRVESILARFAT